jgi:hypothetical protein
VTSRCAWRWSRGRAGRGSGPKLAARADLPFDRVSEALVADAGRARSVAGGGRPLARTPGRPSRASTAAADGAEGLLHDSVLPDGPVLWRLADEVRVERMAVASTWCCCSVTGVA